VTAGTDESLLEQQPCLLWAPRVRVRVRVRIRYRVKELSLGAKVRS
jgi:hypothetical protein